MPLVVRCKECGYVLYDGDFFVIVGKGYGTYTGYRKPIGFQWIANTHEGKCPNCSRTLEPSKAKVIGVSPANES